jgi:hypothetical protein
MVSGLTLAAVSGCDVESTWDSLRAPEPSPTASTTPATPDADETLVATTLAQLAEARTVAASAAALPRLAAVATPLLALHDAHLAALTAPSKETPEASVETPTATTPATPAAPAGEVTLAQLRRTGNRLQGQLAAGAVSAANAELAQLLAVMSAAVAQHVAALPSKVRR